MEWWSEGVAIHYYLGNRGMAEVTMPNQPWHRKGRASRALDIAASAVGLVLASPVLLTAAVAVRLDSPGPILFRQRRVGRGFRPFDILKFRSMVHDETQRGGQITADGDQRITRVGRWLRKTKVDELPQLWNVLRGEMSLVGPRPEVPRYVEMFRGAYEEILRVRPGITDLASVHYIDESALLARAADPEAEYVERILPEKIALAREYLEHASVTYDLKLMVRTVVVLLRSR